MFPPVQIEILDRWDTVPLNEWVYLCLIVTRPADAAGAIRIPAGGINGPASAFNTDLFLQSLDLNPGDSTLVTIQIHFDTPGSFNAAQFRVQVNPEEGEGKDSTLVFLPDHPFRVVPSLPSALQVTLNRICTYDDAVKIEIQARNTSATDLTDVELILGPRQAIRTGPLRRHLPILRPTDTERFDLVITQETLDLQLMATMNGERVEDLRSLVVPAMEESGKETEKPFVFLEPRSLTTDRITLMTEGQSTGVVPRDGVFAVKGGKARYILTIFPSRTDVSGIRLFPARGQVEVEPREQTREHCQFLLTVVENPLLTQLVRLDYDVQVPGTPLRGEIYLAIQPTSFKVWGLAATGGAAVTLKGLSTLPAVLTRSDGSAEGVMPYLGDLLTRNWYDGIQLVSIPLIWLLLTVADYFWSQFSEVS